MLGCVIVLFRASFFRQILCSNNISCLGYCAQSPRIIFECNVHVSVFCTYFGDWTDIDVCVTVLVSVLVARFFLL